MCPRPYDMTRRKQSTEATRTKVLEAARLIIGGRGDLVGFSMDAVARKAGVARMTLYYQFHSREKLLEALADHLAERGGMRRMREVFLEPDPGKALRRLVEVFVGFWATDRVTTRRLRAMAVVSPSRDGGPRDRDAWRRQAVEGVLAKFGRKPGGVRAGGPRDVVGILTALTSFETFDALCVDGRSPEAVARQLTELAEMVVGATRTS
jgi:AcrR family transcriptional regulator